MWLRWLSGAVVGTLAAWAIGPFFLGDIGQWQWLPELDRYGRPPGYVEVRRDEGWGTTRYGEHGISGIETLDSLPRPRVLIWGDSLALALQVDDPEKLAEQVTARCHVGGVGLGESGADVGDYVHNLARYERLISPAAHVVLLSDLSDLEPNGVTFVDSPAFELKARPAPVSGDRELAARRAFAALHAELFYFTAKRWLLDLRRGDFRFAPGRTELLVRQTAPSLPPAREDAWSFALARLREKTTRPIAILYAPAIPALVGGKVSVDDRYAQRVRSLAELAEAHHIDVVDGTASLIASYRDTGELPRGFHNGRPGEGHFNARGLRALAQAICPWLEKVDAVHAD